MAGVSEGIASVQAFKTISLPSGTLDKIVVPSLMKFPIIFALFSCWSCMCFFSWALISSELAPDALCRKLVLG
jgi:hypothetical protein